MRSFFLSAILVTISCCTVLQVSATHIVGGDIHYECLGGNEYLIVLKVYRDCINGISGFDDPASVGIYNDAGVLILNVEIPLTQAVITNLPLDTGDPCLDPPTGICVEECVYQETVTLNVPAGGLHLAYQRCCRNTSIDNCASNDDIGMTIITQIPDPGLAVCNSNPSFNSFPPVFICLNEQLFYDHGATDIDGDSLVYEFCNPLLTNVPGNYINPPGAPPYPDLTFYPQYSFDYPIDSDPAFVINSETGLLTGTPTQLGQYVVGICVKEYRNGQLLSTTNRDFQFNIALCSQEIVADIDEPQPCAGLSIPFENGSVGGETFFWDFGVEELTTDTISSFEPSFDYAEPGVYEVTLIVNAGFQCADTMISQIPVFAPIEPLVSYTGPICESGEWFYEFSVDGALGVNSSFEWDFNGGSPSNGGTQGPWNVGWDNDGNFNVEVYVSDAYCEGEDVVSIDVPTLPQALPIPQSLFCEGLTLTFEANDGGADTWQWNPGDGSGTIITNEPTLTYTYSNYGTYTMTLTANPSEDCSDTETVEIVVLPPDPITGGIILGEPDICDTVPTIQAVFNGAGYTEFTWNFGDGEFSDETPVAHIYDIPGIYPVTLTAYNEFCDVTVSYEGEVNVGYGPILTNVIVPNVFTPNEDSKNQLFRVFYDQEDEIIPEGRSFFDYFSTYRLLIYSRWGNLLYDSDVDGLQGWDGENARENSEGVFYYILEYQRKCIDDNPIRKEGHLTLLRK
jgi:PKD repeat protein